MDNLSSRPSWKEAWDEAAQQDAYMGGAAYGAAALTPRASIVLVPEEALLADELDPTVKKEMRKCVARFISGSYPVSHPRRV